MIGPGLRTALLWLAAVVVAAAAGTAAVQLATSSVTDPLEPVGLPAAASPSSLASPSPTATPTADPTSTPSADDDPSSGPSEPAASPTATGSPTPTTTTGSSPDPTPSATATSSPSPTPSSSPSDDPTPSGTTTRTATSIGGTARFLFADGRVEVVFATPAQGFRVDIEEEGDSARARFRSDDHESRIEAEYDGGQPTVTVDEDAD